MEDDFVKKPHPYSICEKCQKISRDEYRLYIGDVLETKLNLLESISLFISLSSTYKIFAIYISTLN